MSDEAGRSTGAESGLTPEQYLLIQDLVELASQKPADQREPWLRNALGKDAGLLKEALGLLDASDALEPEPDEDVPPGTQIGNYRVVRELGHGGMGSVYLASRADGAYDTDVAIKVVSLTRTNDDLVARFKRERRILASLEHPNIARLLDAGTMTDGRPYFVMEFVRGRSITEYADFHNLSVKDRVRLFITACGAVEYAHQKHVVHRDIKPSNIIVTDDGVPKLLDFGIATSVDRQARDLTRLTATGMAPGTPRYASPEQMAGTDVDIRADVYALGVVLFELLTGWWPFVQGASGETPARPSDAIQTTPSSSFRPNAPKTPTPSVVAGARSATPRNLVRSLRGDLDAIVMQALREDPLERYDSVGEFSADLRRFLSLEPVLARSSGALRRMHLFTRRNRGAVGATMLLVAVGVSAGYFWPRAAQSEPPLDRTVPSEGAPQKQAGVANQIVPNGQPEQTAETSVVITGQYEFEVLDDSGRLSKPNRTHTILARLPKAVILRSEAVLLDQQIEIKATPFRAPVAVAVEFAGTREDCAIYFKEKKLGQVPFSYRMTIGSRKFTARCGKSPVSIPSVTVAVGMEAVKVQ